MRAPAPLAASALALSLLAPARAAAQAAVPAGVPGLVDGERQERPRPFSAAALAGFGFSERPDSQGIGFGLRGGMTAPSRLYLGGTAVYHLGGRRQLLRRTEGTLVYNDVVEANAFYLGGEVGLSLDVGPLVMRPYAGLGLHVLATKTERVAAAGVVEDSTTDVGPYVAPGLTALYPFFDGYFGGVDTRYIITPLELGARGVSIFASVGKAF